MNEFKIGDRVRLDNVVENNTWYMERGLIGKIYTIVEKTSNFKDFNNPDYVAVDCPHRKGHDRILTNYHNVTMVQENNMNTADKLFNSKLSEDEKTLRESGLKDERGRITPEGVTAMMDLLYGVHGKELAAAVRELQKKEDKK